MEHPTEEALCRFLFAVTTPQENHQIVKHLLTRCPSCAEALRKLQEPPPPGAYDRALDRFAAELRYWVRHGTPPPGGPQAGKILAFHR